jgi:hypothetical protein
MTCTEGSRLETVVCVGLLAAIAASSAAQATSTPAALCAASQFKAVGKLASASLACHATTAAKFQPPDPCLTKAITAFEKTWATAEAKGGCTTTVTPSDVETQVNGVVTAAVVELTGTPEDTLLTTSVARACASSKLKAMGKDGKKQLACDAMAALHATLISPKCEVHATGGLTLAFSAAEALSGCATTGDAGSANVNIAGLVTWGLTHIPPHLAGGSCGVFQRQLVLSDPSTGLIGTPQGVAVDLNGNVFVTDHQNELVWKFDSSGKLVKTWGGSGGGFHFGCGTLGEFPAELAADTLGNVYVADCTDVQKFSNDGVPDWSLPTGVFTFGVAVTANGNIDVEDSPLGPAQIEEFDPAGNPKGTVFSASAPLDQITALALDGKNDIYFASAFTGVVLAGIGFDSTGMPLGGGFGSNAYVNGAEFGVAIPPTGNPFFTVSSSFGGGGPTVVWADGASLATLTSFGTPGYLDGEFSPNSNGPVGVAVDKSGNVYVGDPVCVFASSDCPCFPNICPGRIEVFSCPQAAACGQSGQPCYNSPLAAPCGAGLACSAKGVCR